MKIVGRHQNHQLAGLDRAAVAPGGGHRQLRSEIAVGIAGDALEGSWAVGGAGPGHAAQEKREGAVGREASPAHGDLGGRPSAGGVELDIRKRCCGRRRDRDLERSRRRNCKVTGGDQQGQLAWPDRLAIWPIGWQDEAQAAVAKTVAGPAGVGGGVGCLGGPHIGPQVERHGGIGGEPAESDLNLRPGRAEGWAGVGVGGTRRRGRRPGRRPGRCGCHLFPPETDPGSALALIVLDDQRTGAAQPEFGAVGPVVAHVAPFVDHPAPVDIDPDPVVRADREPIGGAGKVERARPAYAVVLCAEARGRGAVAPVKIDRAVVALGGRGACQIAVVEIGAAPVGEAWGWAERFPAETDGGGLAALAIVDDKGMAALVEAELGAVAALDPSPAVEDQLVVDPDAHTAVALAKETVASSGEVEGTCPAHRIACAVQAGRGGGRAPDKIDCSVVAHKLWAALQRGAGVVFASPGQARGQGGRGGRREGGRREGGRRGDGGRRCSHGRGHVAVIGESAGEPAAESGGGKHVQPVSSCVLSEDGDCCALCQRAQDRVDGAGAVAQVEPLACDNGDAVGAGGAFGRGRSGTRGAGRNGGGRRCGGQQVKGHGGLCAALQRIGGHRNVGGVQPEKIERCDKSQGETAVRICRARGQRRLQPSARLIAFQVDEDHFAWSPSGTSDRDGLARRRCDRRDREERPLVCGQRDLWQRACHDRLHHAAAQNGCSQQPTEQEKPHPESALAGTAGWVGGRKSRQAVHYVTVS